MNIEQAREVSSRLRKSPIATVTGSFEVADTIDLLLQERDRLANELVAATLRIENDADAIAELKNQLHDANQSVGNLEANIAALKSQEPVAWRYQAVSPFKDKNGMCNVSENWSLISAPGQIDAHSSMCGMKAEPLYRVAGAQQEK